MVHKYGIVCIFLSVSLNTYLIINYTEHVTTSIKKTHSPSKLPVATSHAKTTTAHPQADKTYFVSDTAPQPGYLTYKLIANYKRSTGSFNYQKTITVTTQSTLDFLHHAEVLCQKFEGPISIAVFAPGTDLGIASRRIRQLRNCGNSCIKKQITWHIITSANTRSMIDDILEKDGASINCHANYLKSNVANYFKNELTLPYPINIARNAARSLARSKYIMATDIELYPSSGIISNFFKLLAAKPELDSEKPNHVFLVPTFEIGPNEKVPGTKESLQRLFTSKKADFFHARMWKKRLPYSPGFYFKNQRDWFKFTDSENYFVRFKRPDLKIGRIINYEPFYISTKTVPAFDETMSWEGSYNKLSQSLEMCLLGYEYIVLGNAFLAHAPGWKLNHHERGRLGIKGLREHRKNNQLYYARIKNLSAKYKRNCGNLVQGD